MPLTSLVELAATFQTLEGREAIRFNNGYRTWKYSYQELCQNIAGVRRFLQDQGVTGGDRLVLWSENRPEWVALFWACVLEGIQAVPIDSQWSFDAVVRIQHLVEPRMLFAGDHVLPGDLSLPTCRPADLQILADEPNLEPAPGLGPEDIVQIVFTSGTTGEPRGIVHRHRNLASNLEPFRKEIQRYGAYARPFQPLRFLSMLPLSHLFGQSMALYIPPMIGGSVVFLDELAPSAVIEAIQKEKISILAVVPKMLSNLQNEVSRRIGTTDVPQLGRGWAGAARRWWRFRGLHRQFGWKFWCFVSGGAPLHPDQESFWRRLGFLVIQGYGLTESSPVIAVNHPFDSRQGTLGKAIDSRNIRLASDGEILVRGDSVASEWAGPGRQEREITRDGWLHTGDIGSIDQDGRLYFKGRKKEMIVKPDGMNVYPDDVERVLHQIPGVERSVVVGIDRKSETRVHAVLILSGSEIDPADLIRQANSQLESHQRIQEWSVWPGDDFPRTPSTQKVKRAQVVAAISGSTASQPEPTALETLLQDLQERSPATASPDLRLAEDLGLTSLDRVELLSRIEETAGLRLDEESFARISTLGQLRQHLGRERHAKTLSPQPLSHGQHIPRWPLRAPIRLFRNAFHRVILLPLFRHFMELTTEGVENIIGVQAPVVFAANHSSHLDTLALLCALPGEWRRRVAPAMLKDYFAPFFQPRSFPWRRRIPAACQYILARTLLNAYPLPHQMSGVREALQHTGFLLESGCCPLIFPEGVRSENGQLQPFRPGVAVIARRMCTPVVPVAIQGTFELYSPGDSWPRSGPIRVRFAPPISPESEEGAEDFTRRLEEAVRLLMESGISQT